MTSAPVPKATRPRNRRDLIVAAATRLFHAEGYDHVGLGDIADAVGIVPSAIYRHFPSRQDLMREVVLAGIAPARELLVDQDPTDRDELVARLVELTLDRPEIGVIWRREARHLDQENRQRLRSEIHAVGDGLARLVHASRPELSAEVAELLGWSMFGILLSSSETHRDMEPAPHEALMNSLCLAVLDAELPEIPAPSVIDRGDRLAPVVRREEILAQSVRLFAEYGFARVSLDDIGASVGIAGPSVYKHFAGKNDILAAAIVRTIESLRLRASEAFDADGGHDEVLRRIIGSYVEFAVDHPDLVTLVLAENGHLPEDVQKSLIDCYRDLIAEMVRLVVGPQPGMSDTEAKVRVVAVLTMINDIARTPSLRHKMDLAAGLSTLATLLLLGRASGDR